jgi:hypothetical protein
LPKSAASSYTHAWRLYLRSIDNEDLRPLVARVVFKLHDSFSQPTRGFFLFTFSGLLFLFARSRRPASGGGTAI